MADLVEVFDAAMYEASLALLAERARELGLRLTELPAVPEGQPPAAVHCDGTYRCPHCNMDQTQVITVLVATASVPSPVDQGIFSREHANLKREAINAVPLIAEGRRCVECGGWLEADVGSRGDEQS